MKYAALLLLLHCGLLADPLSDPAQVAFDGAAQALSNGDYGAAEQGFEAVLKFQLNNVAAIANLGVVYSRMNRVDKAITEYQHALRLSPNDAPILLNLGIVYLKEEMHARALPYFERVLAIDLGNRQARQLRDLSPSIHGSGVSGSGRSEGANARASFLATQQLLSLLGFAYLKNGDSQMAQTTFHQMFNAASPLQVQFLVGKASDDAALFSQSEESFLQVLRLTPGFQRPS